MSNQKIQLATGEIYHIVSRGVGDSLVFQNQDDYYRGIFSIYEFNNVNSVNIWERRQQRIREKSKLGPTSLTLQNRDMFVEILCFSFMPNHIHLLLRQLKNNGISQFMQKVGTGYANYFNKKYNRKGHLFNKFQAVHIKDDEQLKNVFTYIHTNRISSVESNWKESGIKDPKKVIESLENDKWHSYPDYLGKKNFPSVTVRDFLLEIMGGPEGCRTEIENWVRHKKELKDVGDIVNPL